MELEYATEMALELMQQHGLYRWRFEFDRAKSRFGFCNYSTLRISVSEKMVLINNEERVKNIILHEIAHALVGPGWGHSIVWKRKAWEIGCDGKRCYSRDNTEVVKGKIEATCPKCGHIYYKHRMPKRQKSCGKCSNVFNPEYLLVFERK